MTAAWFLGYRNEVPQDESEVRSTVEPVRHQSETAEAQHEPGWNEFQTDSSGELVGLTPRMVGSDTRDTVDYAPFWASLATQNHNAIIDDRIADSGTAAAREMRGEQGHGTMQYALGIEPLIRDGAAFGNDYFESNQLGVNEGAGAYMTPPEQDNWLSSVAQARAADNSRGAFSSTLYTNFLTGG